MKDFIVLQYKLWKSGSPNIGIVKITSLASKYMTPAEQDELFGTTDVTQEGN